MPQLPVAELFRLSSLPNPTEEEADQLIRLIEKDGYIDATDQDGDTPLLLLCRHNRSASQLPRCVEAILKRVKVDDEWREQLDKSLQLLCQFYPHDNLLAIVRLLITKGADANAKTTDRWTALHYLCQNYKNENLVDIVRLLVENGADVNAKTSYKSTALYLLCGNYRNGNLVQIVRLLVEKGVDVNAETESGDTALTFLHKYSFEDEENKNEIEKLLGAS